MTKFRFRFDSRGMSLAKRSFAIEALSGTVTSVGADVAFPLGGDPINAIDALATWIIDHPEVGLDLELLEERQVLLAPPQWSYVSRAAPALAKGEVADAAMRQDYLLAVEKYADMLASQSGVLCSALYLAAWASVASRSKKPGQPLRDAIRALPKGGVLEPPLPDLPLADDLKEMLRQKNFEQWAEMFRQDAHAIATLNGNLNWQDIETISWDEWRRRFQQYRTGRRTFGVNRIDLLLRTRLAGPAKLFENELGEMTIRDWTRALSEALPNGIPAWVRPEIEKELSLERPALLIIAGQATHSPTARWLPSGRNSCLWINAERMTEYKRLLDQYAAFPKTVTLAVELVGDDAILPSVVERDPSITGFDIPARWKKAYLAHERLPPSVTPAVPYIENPNGVDDAVAKLRVALGPTA